MSTKQKIAYGRRLSKINLVTVEPGYNEGPRDWENVFAIGRLRSFEILFYFTIAGAKKIVRYSEDL